MMQSIPNIHRVYYEHEACGMHAYMHRLADMT